VPRRRPSPLWPRRVIQANNFPTTDDREGNILDLPEADDVAIRAKARLRGHQKDSPPAIAPMRQRENAQLACPPLVKSTTDDSHAAPLPIIALDDLRTGSSEGKVTWTRRGASDGSRRRARTADTEEWTALGVDARHVVHARASWSRDIGARFCSAVCGRRVL